eukprot:jgi/Chrzof1/6009/Cz17g00160.t1
MEPRHLLADDAAAEATHGGGTLHLRIASILAAALLLGVPPIFLKRCQSAEAAYARLTRGFAGGIILALALVHIIPEAVAELEPLLSCLASSSWC